MVFTIDKSHPVKAFKSRNVITEFGLYLKDEKICNFSEKSKSRNCIDSSNSVQFAIAAKNGMERFALSCMVRYFL